MSIDSQVELKSLNTQRKRVETELNLAFDEQKEIVEKILILKNKLREFDDRIRNLQNRNSEPIVSEHALLRYIERVMGVDLEEVKNKILTSKLRNCLEKIPSGSFPDPAGFVVKTKNRTVTTIITNNEE